MDNTKKVFDYILTKFFGSYLYLRNNDEVKSNKLANINKAYMLGLKKYYTIL